MGLQGFFLVLTKTKSLVIMECILFITQKNFIQICTSTIQGPQIILKIQPNADFYISRHDVQYVILVYPEKGSLANYLFLSRCKAIKRCFVPTFETVKSNCKTGKYAFFPKIQHLNPLPTLQQIPFFPSGSLGFFFCPELQQLVLIR